MPDKKVGLVKNSVCIPWNQFFFCYLFTEKIGKDAASISHLPLAYLIELLDSNESENRILVFSLLFHMVVLYKRKKERSKSVDSSSLEKSSQMNVNEELSQVNDSHNADQNATIDNKINEKAQPNSSNDLNEGSKRENKSATTANSTSNNSDNSSEPKLIELEGAKSFFATIFCLECSCKFCFWGELISIFSRYFLSRWENLLRHSN